MKTPIQNKSVLVIDRAVLRAIREFIGEHPAERGGILGRAPDGIIRYFVLDRNATCTTTAYDPDIDAMNQQIKLWKASGVTFQGVIHSHPPGYRELSTADKLYAVRILAAFKSLDFLALPLVMTRPDNGQFEIIPFLATPEAHDRKQVAFTKAALRIVGKVAASVKVKNRTPVKNRKRRRNINKLNGQSLGVSGRSSSKPAVFVPTPHAPELRYYGSYPSMWRITASRLSGQERIDEIFPSPSLNDRLLEHVVANDKEKLSREYFQRVTTAFDMSRLNDTRLIVIGTGGAAGLIQDCARAGFGEFVLIDPDNVSASNIATQFVNPADLAMPKTDALAKHIIACNPRAAVVAVHGKIEDITDSDFQQLSSGPLRAEPPATGKNPNSSGGFHREKKVKGVVLLVLTDNFHAQARGHRLGLHFGFPTICAQEYQEGMGAEITFTVPGVTPACHRCITASRYRAYLSEGYCNSVTSHGAPIFSADMLNAALGFVLLAVAHHGTNHRRFGRIIQRLGNRNLILLRMDPDFDEFLGRPTFSRRLLGASQPDAFFMMDSLFLKQTPDSGQTKTRPICPDCGGLGDLGKCIGTFLDTRIMRRG